MSDGLEKLRSIGAQKIHEDTHISLSNVEILLDENFEKTQKVQILGFISILEREYKVNLDSLRQDVKEYFKNLEETTPPKEYVIEEKSPSLPLKHKVIIAALVVILIAMVVAFKMVSFDEKLQEESNATTVTTQKSNFSKEPNTTEPVVEQFQEEQEAEMTGSAENKDTNKSLHVKSNDEVQKEKQAPVNSLVIMPRTKVWLGYIDLKNHKKRQTVTKGSLELNASRDYLLTFGHGYIDIQVGNEIKSFKKAKSIKFVYENGELKEITNDEFRARNKGKLW